MLKPSPYDSILYFQIAHFNDTYRFQISSFGGLIKHSFNIRTSLYPNTLTL